MDTAGFPAAMRNTEKKPESKEKKDDTANIFDFGGGVLLTSLSQLPSHG